MKLAIITSRYPKKGTPYNHMFVHVRAVFFASQGIDVTVFVPSSVKETYYYQGIKVICDHSDIIAGQQLAYDISYLHLLNLYPTKSGGLRIYKAINKHKQKAAIYFHGYDALTHPKYYFDFEWNLRGVTRVLYNNTWKKYQMHRFLKKLIQHKNYVAMAPSNWLKDQIEQLYDLRIHPFKVIPNGIDVSLFNTENAYAKRHKIVCIRPLEKTYPVAHTIELMLYLPEEFTLDIYGKGEMKETLLRLIESKQLSHRVRLIEKFVEREQLPQLLNQYGILCAFSNIDTQGVMMCEAMAARLLVISSNKAAVPEFIKHKQTGLLEENVLQLKEDLLEICADESYFNTIIQNARNSMEKITIERVGMLEIKALETIL